MYESEARIERRRSRSGSSVPGDASRGRRRGRGSRSPPRRRAVRHQLPHESPRAPPRPDESSSPGVVGVVGPKGFFFAFDRPLFARVIIWRAVCWCVAAPRPRDPPPRLPVLEELRQPHQLHHAELALRSFDRCAGARGAPRSGGAFVGVAGRSHQNVDEVVDVLFEVADLDTPSRAGRAGRRRRGRRVGDRVERQAMMKRAKVVGPSRVEASIRRSSPKRRTKTCIVMKTMASAGSLGAEPRTWSPTTTPSTWRTRDRSNRVAVFGFFDAAGPGRQQAQDSLEPRRIGGTLQANTDSPRRSRSVDDRRPFTCVDARVERKAKRRERAPRGHRGAAPPVTHRARTGRPRRRPEASAGQHPSRLSGSCGAMRLRGATERAPYGTSRVATERHRPRAGDALARNDMLGRRGNDARARASHGLRRAEAVQLAGQPCWQS